MGRHREGHERGARDNRALADDRLAAQHTGVGVDGDVVRWWGGASRRLQALPPRVEKSAQRNALVQLHVVTDSGSLTDDNASTVVDEEVLADMSAPAPISIPVEEWAISVITRGMMGTPKS